MHDPADPEQSHRKLRLISVIAGTAIALSCGTNYAFSAWEPEFAERLQLTATQANLIGNFGNIGMYAMGIPGGILIDSKGPRWGVLVGVIGLAVGYFPLHSAYDAGPGSMSVLALCFFSLMTGIASCTAFSAALKVCAMNWPRHRGTATAFPLSAFGLSAFFWTTLSAFLFPDDTSGYLLLLSIGATTLVFVGMIFLRTAPKGSAYDALPGDERPGLARKDSNRLRSAHSRHNSRASQNGETGTTEETSSLVSSNEPGDIVDAKSDPHHLHTKPEITGWTLAKTPEFWKLFLILGLLCGVGLMTINNIGNNTRQLWRHYDETATHDFIQKRQLMHVGILSIMSFCGRLSSGIGSDWLIHHKSSRFWTLVASASIFTVAQAVAMMLENPNYLFWLSGLTGFAYGCLFGVFPALVADAFGPSGMGINWGAMTLAPVVSGNVFNLMYGRILDQHSVITDGERVCNEGKACYSSAYWITLFASLVGIAWSLWVYTASFAFFEALWDAGVTHCFVNLGSDHPSIIEAIVKGQQEKKGQFPRILTCPNEMVAMSMADGYARLTGKPQCVIVHVDVGTQALGQAMHNASCGRAPVLVFAGLSPVTLEGEYRGSRTEYIHWIQDVPDQKAIVAQYCRYTGEIKYGKNVKQIVNRALSFAMSEPRGPVYLVGAREAMEADIEPYHLKQEQWGPVELGGLTKTQTRRVAEALARAREPLVVTGYSGRNHACVKALIGLADAVCGLRVLDTGGSDMCFPADHQAWLGLRYGGRDDALAAADVILVLDCDVPWIFTQTRPKESAEIIHIDVDVLKQQMPMHYIHATARYRVDAETAIDQITEYIVNNLHEQLSADDQHQRNSDLQRSYQQRLETIASQAKPHDDGSLSCSYLTREVRKACPADTIWVVEAVTNAGLVSDQIQATIPGSWINCGGGGLGWSGGGALGVKLATDAQLGGAGRGKFVCQIVGDGTYLFSVPSSVYWIAQRYAIPVLTIVLNNQGWNAPRKSLELVHPNGAGSKVDNKELNISFAPSADYSGIAKAASGGKCWAGYAGTAKELEKLLPQAVAAVKGGVSAVLDAHLEGPEGKFGAEQLVG